MEVMNMLEGDALDGLRLEFSRFGEEGIPLEDYVRLMTAKLLESDKLPQELRSKEKLVALLCEMFNEIDRNGNGRVEWSEFTGYCVEAGFAATRRFVEPLRFRFEEDARYKDLTSRGVRINRLRFLEPVQKLAVFEKDSLVVKLYDTSLKLCAELDVKAAMAKSKAKSKMAARPSSSSSSVASDAGLKPIDARGSGSTRDRSGEGSSGKEEALNCVLAPRKNTLVILSSNLTVSFWDLNNYRPNHVMYSKVPQQSIAFSASRGNVYTAGNDKRMQVWHPERGLRTAYVVTKHCEPITSLAVVEKHGVLASSSMDATIQLFDLCSHELKATMCGHQRGIKQIAYSSQQDMLLSISTELDAFGWDLTSKTAVVKLSGHRFPLIGIDILPITGINRQERAVTADAEGNFRVWDMSRSHTGQGVSLQAFERKPRSGFGKNKASEKQRARSGGKKWNMDDFSPSAFCVMRTTGSIVAADAKMCHFTCAQNVDMEVPPTGALFNPTALSFITATGRDLRIWNAFDGDIKEDMFGISSSEVTCITLDDRERKFILGDAEGRIKVHSYLNGVLMKSSESPHDSDVTGLAYVGREKIVISVGRDRCIKVHDDWPEDEVAPYVRGVQSAHDGDITCVSYSDSYSLIATGSSDTTVRLWDFEFAKLELIITGHSAELSAVAFVGNLGILISADCDGVVLFHMVVPGERQGKCVHRWENRNDAETFGGSVYRSRRNASKRQLEAAVTCLDVHNIPGTSRWLLVLGDDMGVVKCLEISQIVFQEVKHSPPPAEDKYPFKRTGYNARRRIERNLGVDGYVLTGDVGHETLSLIIGPVPSTPSSASLYSRTAPSTPGGASIYSQRLPTTPSGSVRGPPTPSGSIRGPPTPSGSIRGPPTPSSHASSTPKHGRASVMQRKPTLTRVNSTRDIDFEALIQRMADVTELHAVKAHTGALNTIQIISEPLSFVSSSLDRSVRVFSLETGEPLGILNAGEGDGPVPPKWRFDARYAARRRSLARQRQRDEISAKLMQQELRLKQQQEAQQAEQDENERQKRRGRPGNEKRRSLKEKLAAAKTKLRVHAKFRLSLQAQSEDGLALQMSLEEKKKALMRRECKTNMLKQLSASFILPASSEQTEDSTLRTTPPPSAKKTYANLTAETMRHSGLAAKEKKRKVDAEPSGFLCSQLRLGAEKSLKAKALHRLESLNRFSRRFGPQLSLSASCGLLEGYDSLQDRDEGDERDQRDQLKAAAEESQRAQGEKLPNNNHDEEGDCHQALQESRADDDNAGGGSIPSQQQGEKRPRTAPVAAQTATRTKLGSNEFWERWQAQNKSFMKSMSGFLSEAQSPEENAELPPLFAAKQRLAQIKAEGSAHKLQRSPTEWKRRSTILMRRFDKLMLDDDDDDDAKEKKQDKGQEEADPFEFTDENNQEEEEEEENEKGPATNSTPRHEYGRRRTSLIQRQSLFAEEIKKQVKSNAGSLKNDRRLSISLKIQQSRRNSVSLVSSQATSLAVNAQPNDRDLGSTAKPIASGNINDDDDDDDIKMEPSTSSIKQRRSSLPALRPPFKREIKVHAEGISKASSSIRFGIYPESQVKNLGDLFGRFDKDSSGGIDMEEFINCPEFGPTIGPSLSCIFESMDTNMDNQISLVEFLKAFCPKATPGDIANMEQFLSAKHEKLERRLQGQQENTIPTLSASALEEIENLFHLMDKGDTGFVSKDTIAKYLLTEDSGLSKEDVRDIVASFSRTDGTSLTKADFTEMCKEYFSLASEDMVKNIMAFNDTVDDNNAQTYYSRPRRASTII